MLASITWSLKSPTQAMAPVGAGGIIKPAPRPLPAPPSPEADESNGGAERGLAAKRCKISREQLTVLVASFEEEPLPDFDQRQALAKHLGLNPRSVQVWFQNRRQRLKPTTKPKTLGADEAIGGGHCLTAPPPPGFGSARRGGMHVHKVGAIGGGHCLTHPPPAYGATDAATTVTAGMPGEAVGPEQCLPLTPLPHQPVGATGGFDSLMLFNALKQLHGAHGAASALAHAHGAVASSQQSGPASSIAEIERERAAVALKAALAAAPAAAAFSTPPAAPAAEPAKKDGADGLLLLLACAD